MSGLDVERLAVAMNDAQVTCDEIRLGHDLRVPAARIVARLAESRPVDGLAAALRGLTVGQTGQFVTLDCGDAESAAKVFAELFAALAEAPR